jgi:hypothetical protein
MNKSLILSTKTSSVKNSVNSSNTFGIFLDILPHKLYKLSLKSIRALIENDVDFVGEINNADRAWIKTVNVYLKSDNLIFDAIQRSECFLNTYQLSLPILTLFPNIQTRLFDNGNLRIQNTGTAALYSYLQTNNKKPDGARWRCIITGVTNSSYNYMLNRPASFNNMNSVNPPIYDLTNFLFDTGTQLNGSVGAVGLTFYLLEYYNSYEPSNIDDQYNTQITFQKTDDALTTNLTLEYRDIETNNVIASADTNGELYPDMKYLFEIEELA